MHNNYYALFGEHITHSYSPQFHQQFASQFNIELIYKKITVNSQSFFPAWQEFIAQGGKGANVTMPCKRLAYELCTSHSAIAQATGSVNTIRVDSPTQWYGDSTDGVGLIRDIVNYHGHSLTNKRILLLGAGGAAAGILPSLLSEKPTVIVVANRTLANAETLAKNYAQITACDFSAIPSTAFDCIINTAADLPLATINVNFNADAIAYDIRYTPNAQDFIQWATTSGARYGYDGYGMLLEQAAAAFSVWFGIQPATQPLRQTLYE